MVILMVCNENLPGLVMTFTVRHGFSIDGPNRNRWFTVLKKFANSSS